MLWKLLIIPFLAVAAEEEELTLPDWVPAWLVDFAENIPELPLEHADLGVRGLYEGWYSGLELVDYHLAHQECLDNNINRINSAVEDTLEIWRTLEELILETIKVGETAEDVYENLSKMENAFDFLGGLSDLPKIVGEIGSLIFTLGTKIADFISDVGYLWQDTGEIADSLWQCHIHDPFDDLHAYCQQESAPCRIRMFWGRILYDITDG